MDGLQNLLDALDVAKHKHWSQHGVSEHHRTNNDISQTPPGATRHFQSVITRSRSGCFGSSAAEQQVTPYVAPLSFTAAHHNRPAHLSATPPSAQVKMGGFSEMDSKSLVAAALAPHPGVPDPAKVKKGYSSGPITPNSNVTRQKVSSDLVLGSWPSQRPSGNDTYLNTLAEHSAIQLGQKTETCIKCLLAD